MGQRNAGFRFALLGVAAALASVGRSVDAQGGAAAAPPSREARVVRAPFGTLGDGTRVEAFTLTNASGASVTVLTYGGIVASIRVRDRDGKLDDVVLGYETLEGYVADTSYYGTIVGRYANRIGGARFTLDGREHAIAANEGANTLHGGHVGFDRAVWRAEPFERAGAAGVTLSHMSPDGDQGFPGTLRVTVTYTFDDAGALAIDYAATTDAPTVVNLTSHGYFNLAGNLARDLAGAASGDVLDHRLTVHASRYTPVGAGLIPTGELRGVAGTPLDFRSPAAIGARIRDPALAPTGGYDHNYVIDRDGEGLVTAARVEDPASGRVLEVLTTEPGVQLYTANHLDGTKPGRGGRAYGRHAAFCLETQHYPDSPNQPSFPSTTLRPGERFASRTVYAFSVR